MAVFVVFGKYIRNTVIQFGMNKLQDSEVLHRLLGSPAIDPTLARNFPRNGIETVLH